MNYGFTFIKGYSKSESDKRGKSFKGPSSGYSRQEDDFERPDNSRRRLSFDLLGSNSSQTGTKQKKFFGHAHGDSPSNKPNVVSSSDSNAKCSPDRIASKTSPDFHSSRHATSPISTSSFEDQDDTLDSTCSSPESPEQDTVRPKRPSLTCSRGPHVQDLFARGTEVASLPMSESITTACINDPSEVIPPVEEVLESDARASVSANDDDRETRMLEENISNLEEEDLKKQ